MNDPKLEPSASEVQGNHLIFIDEPVYGTITIDNVEADPENPSHRILSMKFSGGTPDVSEGEVLQINRSRFKDSTLNINIPDGMHMYDVIDELKILLHITSKVALAQKFNQRLFLQQFRTLVRVYLPGVTLEKQQVVES